MDKKWAKKANKFFENKMVLYFSLFLAVTTILGFLLLKKWHAVVLFVLIAFILSFITNNMSVILLISIFGANLALLKDSVREGMEDSTTSTTIGASSPNTLSNSTSTNTAAGTGAIKQKISDKASDITTALSSSTAPTSNTEPMADSKSGTDLVSVHKDKKAKNGNDRLDYASTLEAAYDNLETMLDGNSLGKLTEDTQRLMKTQQELFQTMNKMAPMVGEAKSMLEGFNLKGLTDILKPSKNP
jgi:hypothetical protein